MSGAQTLALPSDTAQHIMFEGCDYCLMSPEDYDAIHALNAELLEALRVFVAKYDSKPEGDLGFGFVNGDFDRARAAIARAEGQQS